MKAEHLHNDPGRCPLCDELNHCVMADANQDAGKACWCKAETFSQALLDKVPATEKNQACICQRCLQSNNNQV